ncbi:MAG: HAMP domain-containing sensor histidine kinase [Lysobacteraceae bacterium]
MSLPLTLRSRVAILLALTVFLIALLAGGLIILQTLRSGSLQIASLAHAALIAADQPLASQGMTGDAETTTPHEVRVRRTAQPPVDFPQDVRPFVMSIRADVERLAGDASRVRLTEEQGIHVWLRSRYSDDWLGIRVEPLREPVVVGSLLALGLAAALVALAAGWIAKISLRPLERLARGAPALLQGGVMPALSSRAPREIHALAKVLKDAGDRVRRDTREREMMLAGVSHDLRTPLARLRLALELGDAEDPLRRAAMVDDIEAADAIIGTWLDYVRESSDESLVEMPVDAIREWFANLSLATPWQLEIVASSSHLRVRPRWLQRALRNLIENAGRHGRPPFHCVLRQQGGACVIEVRDHGDGVSEAIIERLREPFFAPTAPAIGRAAVWGWPSLPARRRCMAARCASRTRSPACVCGSVCRRPSSPINRRAAGLPAGS